MDSTEAGSVDDSLDSKNLQTPLEEEVSSYEVCTSEVLSSQNEDQGGEQVYGYLEVRGANSEDATIYVDSEGFNFNGQSLIVTQHVDGNEILVLVSEDPNGEPVEETYASVLHSEEVNFVEEGLKVPGAIVVEEQPQGLEFIETEEAPEGHEERHVYIENNNGVLNLSTDHRNSPVSSATTESSLWAVPGNSQLKNDSTEMVFIPNPTVVLAPPEETKHRKLMQLACIAHKLQSADQKAISASECAKDSESSLNEFESSVCDTENDGEKDMGAAPLSADEEMSDKNDEREKYFTFNDKSVNVSSLLSCTSARTIDNTVSVIHATSEVQDTSLENRIKSSCSSDFSSDKHLQDSNHELPSEVLYSNESNVTYENLNDSSSAKPLEDESPNNNLEENSRLSVPDDTADRDDVPNSDLVVSDDGSSEDFIEKTQKLVVHSSDAEDNPLVDDTSMNGDVDVGDNDTDMNGDVDVGDNDTDMKDDDVSPAESPVLVVEEDETKDQDDSSVPYTENYLSNDAVVQEETSLRENVPNEVTNKLVISNDDDDLSNDEDHKSLEKNKFSFLPKNYSMYSYKKKAKNSPQSKASLLQDDRPVSNDNQYDFNDSYSEKSKDDELDAREDSDVEERSFLGNSDSSLVIAEKADDESSENQTVEATSTVSEAVTEACPPTENSNSQPVRELEMADPEAHDLRNAETPTPKFVPPDVKLANSKESKDMNNSMSPVSVAHNVPKDDEEFSSTEEPLVKPPKKTYIKKRTKKSMSEYRSSIKAKIELFSELNFTECDKDINEIGASLFSDQQRASTPSPIPQDNSTESDDHLLLSGVQSKVSATYNRKKKSTPLLNKGLRFRSLRTRSLPSASPLKKGAPKSCDSDLKKDNFDSSSAENIPWGDVLLKTSFSPCDATPDAAVSGPSTSYDTSCPKETTARVLSPEQRRRKLNKYKRDFDRLLNSSPGSSKQQSKSNRKPVSRGRKKVKSNRTKQSGFSPSRYSRFSDSSRSPSIHNNPGPSRSQSTTKLLFRNMKRKEAKIQYLYRGPPRSPPEKKTPSEMYTCSSCSFQSHYVDNLMEHLKYCSNRQPVLDYEVYDMDKRQRIRGEEGEELRSISSTLKQIREDIRSALMDDEPNGDDERDADNIKKRKKYGYGKDDVVWVKFKDRFWPALVCEIKGNKAYVKLISYPKEVKGLKVKHENIRTFDNSKWNLLCLGEAGTLPHNEIFVKAVQSCERFMSKKFLGVNVTGKEFFSVRDEVDFATDSASSDNSVINEDSDSGELTIAIPPTRKSRYEKLDIDKIYRHIIDGKVDDYVLAIYNKTAHSKKHEIFFEADNSELKQRQWFGPCDDSKLRQDIFRHFQTLFLKNIGRKKYFISYICQVWIPEAIVKAISVVEDIPLQDAEILFESEDSLDLESDPSIEDIIKKYS